MKPPNKTPAQPSRLKNRQNSIVEAKKPSELNRRDFVKSGLGVAGFAAASAMLAASCGGGKNDPAPEDTEETQTDAVTPEIEWEMALSWRPELEVLFATANFFARKVSDITGGRFKINPRPAGELVGALDVLSAVSNRNVDAGYTASYYYMDVNPTQIFGTSVPFGFTQRQQNAWLYHDQGLEMLNDYNSEEHGIITFPVGGAGCQMGGWFTKEIKTLDDLQGLRMRMPGLGGRILEKFGAEVERFAVLSIEDILPSMKDGTLDAAELSGPSDDLALGFDEYEGDLYYYYPGWWEPGAVSEVQISLDRWAQLPPNYQAAIETAAMAANLNSVADYDTRNSHKLEEVEEFARIREFPPQLLAAFKQETENELDDIAAGNTTFSIILDRWRSFRSKIVDWHQLAELSYLSQQAT